MEYIQNEKHLKHRHKQTESEISAYIFSNHKLGRLLCIGNCVKYFPKYLPCLPLIHPSPSRMYVSYIPPPRNRDDIDEQRKDKNVTNSSKTVANDGTYSIFLGKYPEKKWIRLQGPIYVHQKMWLQENI